MWYERKPNVTNLRIFGTVAYLYVQDQFRSKFDKKSEDCIMMGYANNDYRLYGILKGIKFKFLEM